MAIIGAVGGNPDAITTALIALGGAIIGGGITAGAQLLIEGRRVSRESAAQAGELKIAARFMQVDLARAWSNIEYSARTGRWWPKTGLIPRISDNDRRLVLGALPAKGFSTVDLAESAIDFWYGVRDDEIQRGESHLAPRYDTSNIASVLVWIQIAEAALREITGDPSTLGAKIGEAREFNAFQTMDVPEDG